MSWKWFLWGPTHHLSTDVTITIIVAYNLHNNLLRQEEDYFLTIQLVGINISLSLNYMLYVSLSQSTKPKKPEWRGDNTWGIDIPWLSLKVWPTHLWMQVYVDGWTQEIIEHRNCSSSTLISSVENLGHTRQCARILSIMLSWLKVLCRT